MQSKNNSISSNLIRKKSIDDMKKHQNSGFGPKTTTQATQRINGSKSVLLKQGCKTPRQLSQASKSAKSHLSASVSANIDKSPSSVKRSFQSNLRPKSNRLISKKRQKESIKNPPNMMSPISSLKYVKIMISPKNESHKPPQRPKSQNQSSERSLKPNANKYQSSIPSALKHKMQLQKPTGAFSRNHETNIPNMMNKGISLPTKFMQKQHTTDVERPRSRVGQACHVMTIQPSGSTR